MIIFQIISIFLLERDQVLKKKVKDYGADFGGTPRRNLFEEISNATTGDGDCIRRLFCFSLGSLVINKTVGRTVAPSRQISYIEKGMLMSSDMDFILYFRETG